VPRQSALIAATGKSERTIRRYWPQVVAHVTAVTAKARSEATPATRWSLEKKLTSFVDPHQPGTANTTITTDPLAVPTDPLEASKTRPVDPAGWAAIPNSSRTTGEPSSPTKGHARPPSGPTGQPRPCNLRRAQSRSPARYLLVHHTPSRQAEADRDPARSVDRAGECARSAATSDPRARLRDRCRGIRRVGRDWALSDRPPDPVVIHVDPRLLHDE
jgi:hypothetical protein